MTNPLRVLAIVSCALIVAGLGIATAGFGYLWLTEDEWRLGW